MGKLRDMFDKVSTHLFWAGSGGVSLAVLVTWFITSTRLAGETEERVNVIKRKYSECQPLVSDTSHPNPASTDGMESILKSLRTSVKDAWDTQYKYQDTAFVWPKELQLDFIERVKPLRPIETEVEFPPPNNKEKVDRDFRARYMVYIEREFPKLADIVQADWRPSSGGMMAETQPTSEGIEPASPAAAEASAPIVNWSPQSQSELHSRFQWTEPPTTLEMLYAQEDLWVLEALLKIIKATNGTADANYNAPVKEIEMIQLGKAAVAKAGQVFRPAAAAEEGPAFNNFEGALPGQNPMEDPAMSNPAAGVSGGGSDIDPAENRYVDLHYQPLTASKLRSLSESNNPDDAFLAVAKRMPIRMRLKMDQRMIAKLLAECGNSKIAVEVRQVRVNRSSGVGQAGGMQPGNGGGAMAPGVFPNPGGMNPGLGAQPGFGPRAGAAAIGGEANFGDDAYDVPVEIYGIVFIYNPPNGKYLDLDDEVVDADQAANAETGDADAQPVDDVNAPIDPAGVVEPDPAAAG